MVYKLCANQARTAAELARCVVPLLNSKKTSRIAQENMENSGQHYDLWSDMKSFFRQYFPFKTSIQTNNKEVETWKASPLPAKEYFEFDEFKARHRRFFSDESPTTNQDELVNVKNLKKLLHYSEIKQFCESYVKQLNDENSRTLNNLNPSAPRTNFVLEDSKNVTILEEVMSLLNTFLANHKGNSKMSILSPRFLSLLPSNGKHKNNYLSPSLFSFQDDDNGFLTLPQLIKLATNQNPGKKGTKQVDLWLELLLQASGAGPAMQKALDDLQPQIDQLFPSILELERLDDNWKRVQHTLDDQQVQQMKQQGYAFLESMQLNLLYGEDQLKHISSDYHKMSQTQREARLEASIRQLAKLDTKTRSARSAEQVFLDEIREIHEEREKEKLQNDANWLHSTNTTNDGSSEEKEKERELIELRTLAPFAFSNRVGEGVALEALTLSPHAFLSELLSPEALVANVLSPRAFISSVLSPGALMARVLSPAAFRAEILSPRALTAFVLTPEALIAEVLSPKVLDTRILSPEALIVKVLSPSLLAPKVLSPEAIGITVLSPSILSPHILSGEKLMLEIISPHVLSGGSEEEHEGGGHSHGLGHEHVEQAHSSKEHPHLHNHKNEGDGAGHVNHAHSTKPHAPSRQIAFAKKLSKMEEEGDKTGKFLLAAREFD